MVAATKHFVYILRCSDDSLYTGYAIDIERRLIEHNGESKVDGAKYTRGRRPVTILYSEGFKTRSEALKREAVIKKLSRTEKLQLTKSNTQVTPAEKKKSAL